MQNKYFKIAGISKKLFLLAFVSIFPSLSYSDFSSAREAQQQAYGNYTNSLMQMTNPTAEDVKNLRSQVLTPANEAAVKTQQQELNANFPSPPVPSGTNSHPTGAEAQKNKDFHNKRFKKILAKLHSLAKKGAAPSKGGAAPRQTGTSSSGPARPSVEVHGNFEKEIEFSSHHDQKDKSE